MVSWTAGSQALRCLGQRGAMLCGVLDSVEPNYALSRKKESTSASVESSGEPNSAVSWTAGSQVLRYLGQRVAKSGENLFCISES